MDVPAFLPHLEGFRIDEYTATAERITLRVAATAATAPCPACQLPAQRIHSRYARTVADVAWGGVPVTLRVQVRRFFCGNTACPRRIFAERLPRLVDRYARQTGVRRAALQRIGLALGGATGARLASPPTLPPPAPAPPPRPKPTVRRIRQRFVERGLEAALDRQAPRRAYARKLDGAQEARLVAVACGAPPVGRKRWSLRLLVDKLIELEIAEEVSYQTVRRILKKTT